MQNTLVYDSDCVPLDAKDTSPQNNNGAGILLFTMVPTESDGYIPHFLLAREAYDSRWRLPFSGFEGSSKSTETAEETAAREFVEESLAIVPGLNTYANVLAMLNRRDYFTKISQLVYSENGAAPARYVTFVVQIEYESSLQARFCSLRSQLYDARTVATAARCERCEMQPSCDDGWVVAGRGRSNIPPLASAVKALQRMYERDRGTFDMHPAVSISRDDNGQITELHVHSDYLEKDLLEMWSIEQTEDAIKGKDSTKPVKPYFVPTLHAAINAVRAAIAGDEEEALRTRQRHTLTKQQSRRREWNHAPIKP